jgi:hypothetical protein
MGEPFIGSEAVARGDMTKSQLCTRYTRLLRDVYVDSGVEVTAALRAKAGWLWAPASPQPRCTVVGASTIENRWS